MAYFPVFLSVAFVVRNQAADLERVLREATDVIAPMVTDYELVVVDNASDDDSIAVLKRLCETDSGLSNLQIYALTKQVDLDTACWVGLENALGDFIAVVDPVSDDINFLPAMLEEAVTGADVVFASSSRQSSPGIVYRLGRSSFNVLYKWFNGIDLAKEAPRYRVMSKRVVNFILQHPQPALTYRHLPASGGFAKANLAYDSARAIPRSRKVGEALDRGVRLLVSTTRGPMRVVTALSLFGAVSNLVYSAYVIASAFLKADIAPGWVTLSLQQSGMFFLISLVLLVLGEYILQMARLSNEGPPYHVAQEFNSAVMTRRTKLNVESPDTVRSRAAETATVAPTAPDDIRAAL